MYGVLISINCFFFGFDVLKDGYELMDVEFIKMEEATFP
jgi:hypothetical protein